MRLGNILEKVTPEYAICRNQKIEDMVLPLSRIRNYGPTEMRGNHHREGLTVGNDKQKSPKKKQHIGKARIPRVLKS